MRTELTGLIAATFTPFTENFEINFSIIPAIIDLLEQDGITGIYINGSTGEGPSLTINERDRLMQAYIESARGRLTTIVQVGTNSLKESKLMAAGAAEYGADAISSTPPSYFKPDNAATLAECIAEVASGAPDLPYYYYHIPTMTGVTVNMEEFLKAADNRIPNLAGIKFCSSAMHEMRRCISFEDGRYEILSAWDEMLLSGLATGARGAVGSTFNFAAPLYHKLISAFSAGNLKEARLWQDRALEMLEQLFATCGRAGLKAMMTLRGIDCGPQRLPIKCASDSQMAELRKAMDRIGFFTWIK